MGTTAPALAVAAGTKNAKIIETTIAPITILFVLFPTIESTCNAKRLCKLVTCIAVAKNNAAATSATADPENPLKAICNALPVPSNESPSKAFPFADGLPKASPKF